MSDTIQHCLRTIESLVAIFEEIEAYVSREHLWDPEVLDALHLRRQSLTAELYTSFPKAMPVELEKVVLELHHKTKSLLSRMAAGQQETRDALFKLQHQHKAQQAYAKIANQ